MLNRKKKIGLKFMEMDHSTRFPPCNDKLHDFISGKGVLFDWWSWMEETCPFASPLNFYMLFHDPKDGSWSVYSMQRLTLFLRNQVSASLRYSFTWFAFIGEGPCVSGIITLWHLFHWFLCTHPTSPSLLRL